MRYTYKVFELGPEILDPKKKYHIEYRNKKNNYISRTIEGRNNG